jgi:hypothetical protein
MTDEFLAILQRGDGKGRGTYGGDATAISVFVGEALRGKFGAFSLLTIEPIEPVDEKKASAA